MEATIRKCNKCNYQTIIMTDNLKNRFCHKCKEGNLEIIAREVRNEKR